MDFTEFQNLSDDQIFRELGRIYASAETAPSLVNDKKMNELLLSHTIIDNILRDDDMTVSLDINQPFKGDGCVTIKGGIVRFTDMRWLAKAVSGSYCVEINPLANGGVQMDVGFHGLTTSI